MKIIKVLGILFLILVVFVFLQLFIYRKIQENNLSCMGYCKTDQQSMFEVMDEKIRNNRIIGFKIFDFDCCYCRMRTLFLPRLLIYKVKHKNKPLKFIKPEKFPILIPSVLFEESDAFISYGVLKDHLLFEEGISTFYNKKLYAYDCRIDKLNTENPNIIFKSECIGTDNINLQEKNNSGKVYPFEQKLKEMDLLDKKFYIRIDMPGAETEIMPDILKHSDNIVGFTVHIDLINSNNITKEIEMLKLIEKDFVLVSRSQVGNYVRNNCRYTEKRIAKTYILTYINKNFVDSKYIPFKQDYISPENYILLYPNTNGMFIEYKSNWIVVLNEKLRNFYRKIKGIKE